jgi:hypothetical protein
MQEQSKKRKPRPRKHSIKAFESPVVKALATNLRRYARTHIPEDRVVQKEIAKRSTNLGYGMSQTTAGNLLRADSRTTWPRLLAIEGAARGLGLEAWQLLKPSNIRTNEEPSDDPGEIPPAPSRPRRKRAEVS